jgi:hypothetical protein
MNIQTAREILDVSRHGDERTEISKEGFAKLPAFDQGLRPKDEASVKTQNLLPPLHEREAFYKKSEHPVTLSPATNFLLPHRSQFHDLYVSQAQEWNQNRVLEERNNVKAESKEKGDKELAKPEEEKNNFREKIEQQRKQNKSDVKKQKS